MIDINISPLHNYILDSTTNSYGLQTIFVIEIYNKSIRPVEINHLQLSSKKKFFFNFRSRKEYNAVRNDIIDSESTFVIKVNNIRFENKRKYQVIINNEYFSNEI